MKNKFFIFWQRSFLTILIFILGGVIGYRWAKFGGNSLTGKLSHLVNLQTPAAYQDVDFSQFWQVWEILERDYLDPEKLNREKMVQGAIRGMTAALGDPYTMYLPPVEQKRAQEDLQGSFYGVGIQLGYIDGALAVIAPLKGGPAIKQGVKAGDLILHVKDEQKNIDEDSDDWSLEEAVNKIRGEKNTSITLTLYRKDENRQFDVTIFRDEIIIPSVELEFIEANGRKIAHLQLAKFGERTQKEFDRAVAKIAAEPGLAGVILDLRNNPGGFFEGAINVASEFISKGVVVSQQDKYRTQDFKARGQAKLADLPVVVLVNKGSASASEIVAGALRDQRDAKLVGERTFGKGTVQDARQLENGAGLHVTVARWLLPNGDWINESGLPVDIEVKDDPKTEIDEVLQAGAKALFP